ARRSTTSLTRTHGSVRRFCTQLKQVHKLYRHQRKSQSLGELAFSTSLTLSFPVTKSTYQFPANTCSRTPSEQAQSVLRIPGRPHVVTLRTFHRLVHKNAEQVQFKRPLPAARYLSNLTVQPRLKLFTYTTPLVI